MARVAADSFLFTPRPESLHKMKTPVFCLPAVNTLFNVSIALDEASCVGRRSSPPLRRLQESHLREEGSVSTGQFLVCILSRYFATSS